MRKKKGRFGQGENAVGVARGAERAWVKEGDGTLPAILGGKVAKGFGRLVGVTEQ